MLGSAANSGRYATKKKSNFDVTLFSSSKRLLVDYYTQVTFTNVAHRKPLGLFVKIILQNR